jgi:hypothetical protein
MTDINQLLNEIRLATDFQINKKLLREKISTDLHITHNGGMFKLTPELFAFVKAWNSNELYLEDCYQNPIKVDKESFLTVAEQHYHQVMNRWHNEYEKLKTIRKI